MDRLTAFAKDNDRERYESTAQNLVAQYRIDKIAPSFFAKRTALIIQQITPHLPPSGTVILDYGCGNGAVGAHTGSRTILSDVYQHEKIKRSPLIIFSL